jgi:hypothetical protein
VSYFFRPCLTRQRDTSPLHPALKAAGPAYDCQFLNPPDPFSPIQSTLPSMGAASFKSLYQKRPVLEHENSRFAVGALDTALRHIGYQSVFR